MPPGARTASAASQEPPMTDLVPLSQARCMPRKGQEHRLGEASVRELLAPR